MLYTQERTIVDPSLRAQRSGLPQISADSALQVTEHYIDLPQCTLHYVKCGQGPALVIVPATVSRVDSWRALIQLMGKHFTVYFFELPGHGGSTPFAKPFSSDQVADTVRSFIDELGHEKVSLMGFSFGGILAMKTLALLQDRVERVFFIAPALTKRALSFSRFHLWAVRSLVRALQNSHILKGLYRLIRSRTGSSVLATFIRKFASVEATVDLQQIFAKISFGTCEVMARQFYEVLTLDLPQPPQPFEQPCYFAMSVNDPMLAYQPTLQMAQKFFKHVQVKSFDLPYHQPPTPPTVDELTDLLGDALDQL